MYSRIFPWLYLLLNMLSVHVAYADEGEIKPKFPTIPFIDLRDDTWGDGSAYRLDGMWHAYWGKLYSPPEIETTLIRPIEFPVPAVWGAKSNTETILPVLGYMTYRTRVMVPEKIQPLYLYVPDMPSAYKLWVNGELIAKNGTVGKTQEFEIPHFLPKVVQVPMHHKGELDLVIQLSNYHYREGGIWFSLRLTDDAGVFSVAQRPVILAVLFGTILIVFGLYNLSMFAFRSKEVAALYFGWLCLAVGLRRLLIDERVIYMFDLFSWDTLQRIEHLCFYLSLPLFVGFFCSLYRSHIPAWSIRSSWLSISPFVLLCLAFPVRIYSELNFSFQMVVVASIAFVCCLYIKVAKEKGKNIKFFGISLLLMALAVIHDVLKSNGIIPTTSNIAHFGVLAFVASQSLALQRHYLKNLSLVEAMSTKLESRNKELLEIDEFKDEFLATTSHELRTPLQGISGLAKVLKEEDQGSLTEDQRHKVTLIANTTQRLSVLVNDILDFSSIKHGKLKLNKSRVDLSAIAELVFSTIKPTISGKDIALSAQIAPEVRYLNADEFRLQQILFNLIGNAAKYTEQGFIKLIANIKDNEVMFEITDSGVGIPDEKRASLFRPFEQVHVAGHHAASGTGLGLSISRQLVELHGGSLVLNSRVGQGTTVSMVFPSDLIVLTNEASETTNLVVAPSHSILPTQETKGDSVESSEQHTSCDGPIIFVVDDEPVNCELVSSQLRKQGYQVEVFEDGLKVLSRLTEKLPDLVLLDFMMPGMSGLEVCQSIRTRYDSYELPVMMLTARLQISDIVNALSAGANDYLIKPYHEQELLARVNTQLSVRKYWIANRENQKLKSEIERRETLEEELSELNARLLNVLDVSTELIILLNDQLQIIYANEKANIALCDHQQGLLGQAVLNLVNDDLGRELQRLIKEQPSEAFSMNTAGMTPEMNWNASIKSYFEYGKAYLALVITPIFETMLPETNAATSIEGLSIELNESRKKIDEIEGALRQVISEPPVVEPDTGNLEHISSELPDLSAHKEAVVLLLRSSLNLWERHTSKGKIELAERSRCWRVYVDGTTVKTRTFDKYLNVRSVPDRPRWRAVVRTANYVLANCELSNDENQELTLLLQSVEDYYS